MTDSPSSQGLSRTTDDHMFAGTNSNRFESPIAATLSVSAYDVIAGFKFYYCWGRHFSANKL